MSAVISNDVYRMLYNGQTKMIINKNDNKQKEK